MRVLHTHQVSDILHRPFSLVLKPQIQGFQFPGSPITFFAAIFSLCFFAASPNESLAQPGCDNVVNGGTIQAYEFGCPNPTWDPSPITNVTLPTGGTGTLQYIWIFTTDDPNLPLSQWTPIPNSNSPTYDPGPIAVTTHYRRCARRSGCNDYIGESNIITKEAVCCINVTDGGKIAGDQQLCPPLADPVAIVNTMLPTDSTNAIEYQWVSSTTGTLYTPTNPDWTIIAGATSQDYDPGILSQTTYFIRLSKGVGCTDYTGVSNMVTITIGQAISLTVASANETCPGDGNGAAWIATLSGGLLPYAIVWNDPAAQTSDTIAGLAPGTYIVTVTDSLGCTATASAVVAAATPMVLSLSHTNATCGNTQDGTATVQVVGGTSPFTFAWSGTVIQSTQTITGLSPGTYVVTVSDANGCTASGSEVVQAPMPVALSASATNVTCFGANDGTATVTIQGGDPAFYTFLWDDPLGTTSPTATGLPPGMYTVMVADTNGCMATAAVTVDEPVQLNLTLTATAATCFDGNDGTASVVAAGGTPFPNGAYQYLWSAPGNPTQQAIMNLAPGSYSVTVTDANGCTASSSVVVDAPEKVTPTITAMNVLCAGDANGTATATATGGNPPYSFLWNNPGASTTATVSNLAPGTYGLTVTDANGCTGTSSTTISEPPALTLLINKVDVICENDTNGTATAVPAGGVAPYTYLWSGGQTTVTVNGLGTGLFNVTVTDGNGCEIAGTTQIVYTSTLSSAMSATNAKCFGSLDGTATAIGIDGAAPYTYNWNNGDTTAAISGLGAGSYQVTVTDNNGCTVANSISVTSPSQLLCQAFVTSPVTVYQGTDGAAIAGASGGVAPYSFVWDNGILSDSSYNLSPGNHSVSITDANGCACIAQVSLNSPSKIGNFVWNDLNQNGIQDTGEPGVAGITVQLSGTTNAGQNPVNLTTTTDSTGQYKFDGLVPGFYKIKVVPSANQVFTYQDVGNDALDSDFSAADSSTVSFPLPQGFYDSKWDAGLVVLDEKVNIGDYVWFDQNHDGIQDPTESGISGVNVKLIAMPGNTIVAVQTTNLLGKYLFQDVMPGTYLVEFNPNSLPNGYIFSPRDQGNDDTRDSDPFVNTGRTAQFQVFPFTLDNLTLDAGAFKECDNITDGGLIGYDEDLCGTGSDPSEIVSIIAPSGGFGPIEYLWLSSNIPVYNGPGDPNWSPIPNSNTPNYNPPPIGQTTYYIRCSRRQGCPDYPGESNIVAKTITSYPLTQIIDEPYELCKLETGRFEAAIAGGGAAYFWQFGNDAVPQTASTRVVNTVYWTTPGTKTVTLTVTRFGCSYNATTTVLVNGCGINLTGGVNGLEALLAGDAVQLTWQTTGNLSNALLYVQCSENGIDFKNITVIAAGSSTNGKTFSYLDTRPRLGENVYRIKYEQLTDQQQEGYSATARVFYQPEWAGRVQSYPNPTSGSLTVELLHPDQNPARVEIRTPFGKVLQAVEMAPGSEKAYLDLKGIADGIYMVVVKQEGFRDQILKVMKTQ
ncbi:MAG: T9SS type A sorting domain-containing protein [Saprospiraceae bacterium]|nr:T9SS type A sorting domain-containing protein [Saprospiraceae bacterium]